MSLYRMKFTDATIGDYWGTFWVNDNLFNNSVNNSDFANSLGECMIAIDDTFGTSEWQMFQQTKYDNVRNNLGLVNAPALQLEEGQLLDFKQSIE